MNRQLQTDDATVELERKTILVVDDQDYLAWALKELLEFEGHEVVIESNGKDAVRRVEMDIHRFDAVVCDYSMPGMYGTEVLFRVRKLAPCVRTILMSGHPVVLNEAGVGFEGVDAVLVKPFATDDLVDCLYSAAQPG